MKTPVVLVALALATACASKNPQPVANRSSANSLTRDELVATKTDNAYDAVMRLRPAFLRTRSTGTNQGAAYAVLYIDGIRRGALELLRGIPVSTVAGVRYLSAVDASTRYGLNVEGGVLEVTTTGRP